MLLFYFKSFLFHFLSLNSLPSSNPGPTKHQNLSQGPVWRRAVLLRRQLCLPQGRPHPPHLHPWIPSRARLCSRGHKPGGGVHWEGEKVNGHGRPLLHLRLRGCDAFPFFQSFVATTLVPIISVADCGEGRGGFCGARKV